MYIIRMVLFVLSGVSAVVAAEPGERPLVPEYIEVSLTADAEEYVLGDNAMVHFRVGVSSGTALFNTGGDYRGVNRALRYKLTAVRDDGHAAADTYPGAIYYFGGLSGNWELSPEKPFVASLSIPRYRMITEPGTYTITVRHDGGWRASSERPYPAASVTLRFREPRPGEAAALVSAWQDMPMPVRIQGQRVPPFPDWQTIRHPAFLQPLLAAAEAGSADAMQGLGSIETPEATAALLTLIAPESANDDTIIQAAFAALAHRAVPRPLRGQSDNEEQRLHRHSWRDHHTAPLLEFARGNLMDPAFDSQAGRVLAALGSSEDLPLILKAFNAALSQESQQQTIAHDQPLRVNAGGFDSIVEAIIKREGPLIDVPASRAEIIAWVKALRLHPDHRPADWRERLTAVLESDDRQTLALVLANLPKQPKLPESLHPRLIALMSDDRLPVAYAAVEAARRENLAATPQGVAAFLELMNTHTNTAVIGSATLALKTQPEQRWPLVQALVARMAEPALTYHCVSSLEFLWDNFSGSSGSAITSESARACAAAWRRFITAQAQNIAQGKTWTLPHPEVRTTLVPAGMHFTNRNGEYWPPRQR